ncbi:GNAT family N-acetyltransferase [bacterium]|nr:GNAT family N-acetyltransferase [bacterium]
MIYSVRPNPLLTGCPERFMDTSFSVRTMEPEEKKAINRMVWKNLSFFEALLFYLSRETLVAVHDDEIVGVVTFKVFKLSKNRTIGLMAWAATAKSVRGSGVGRALYDKARARLLERGADDIVGCVEGLNIPSWRLLSTENFSWLGFTRQIRRYGLFGTFKLWIKIFHLPDIGHFLWVGRADGEPLPERHRENGSELLAWIGNLFAMLVLATGGLWRMMGDVPKPSVILVTLLCYLLLFGAREAGMRLVAAVKKIPVRFRAWESGYVLAGVMATAFGTIIPLPGNVYPKDMASVRRETLWSTLGPIALGGITAVLVVMGVSWWLRDVLTGMPGSVAKYTFIFGSFVYLIDVALPFFPFTPYNGRRLLAWHKAVWGIAALIGVGLFFLW